MHMLSVVALCSYLYRVVMRVDARAIQQNTSRVCQKQLPEPQYAVQYSCMSGMIQTSCPNSPQTQQQWWLINQIQFCPVLYLCVNTVQLLQVIFMFGEIDCREGLTMAVDKLKYETVDAAMEVLLTIYKGAPSTQV